MRITKAEAKKMMGRGERMITGAEFQLAFGSITREQFDAEVKQGNDLILEGLDILRPLSHN